MLTTLRSSCAVTWTVVWPSQGTSVISVARETVGGEVSAAAGLSVAAGGRGVGEAAGVVAGVIGVAVIGDGTRDVGDGVDDTDLAWPEQPARIKIDKIASQNVRLKDCTVDLSCADGYFQSSFLRGAWHAAHENVAQVANLRYSPFSQQSSSFSYRGWHYGPCG